MYVSEAEATKQKTETANSATGDGEKPSVDNKQNPVTSSQDMFLPYDVTSGEYSVFFSCDTFTLLANSVISKLFQPSSTSD